MVKDYKNLLVRVQRWHGVDKPVTPFSLQEMHEYMDMRRRKYPNINISLNDSI
jgi:hypothetical protein